MQDFVESMIEEKKEIEEFITKIRTRNYKLHFLIKNQSNIKDVEKYLLQKQFEKMCRVKHELEEYLDVLNARIDLYNSFDEKEKNDELQACGNRETI